MKKMEKVTFQKKQKNSVFWVVVKKKVIFVKMAFIRKTGKHYLCSEGTKTRAFSLQLSVFGNGPFLVPIQSHQTLQK